MMIYFNLLSSQIRNPRVTMISLPASQRAVRLEIKFNCLAAQIPGHLVVKKTI